MPAIDEAKFASSMFERLRAYYPRVRPEGDFEDKEQDEENKQRPDKPEHGAGAGP